MPSVQSTALRYLDTSEKFRGACRRFQVATAFPFGEWNNFVAPAKRSYHDDGFINIWWNGKRIVQYHGPTCCNDDLGLYLKFGIYREDDTDKTCVTYVNRVKFGSKPEGVGFHL